MKASVVSLRQPGRFAFESEGVTIHQVRCGSAICRTDNQTHKLVPQGFLVLNARQSIEIEICNEQTQCLSVQLPVSYSHFDECLNPHCEWVDAELSQLALKGLCQDSVSRLVKAIEVLSIKESKEFFLRQPIGADVETVQRMKAARDFVFQSLSKPIGLDDIADAVNLSPFHFHRQFQKLHGVTPYEYLRLQRIRWACLHLIISDCSIAKVARLSGLQSPTSFIGMFKKSTRFRPTEFREMNRPWRSRLRWYAESASTLQSCSFERN
jgi:AraC-like DNA-binding protein